MPVLPQVVYLYPVPGPGNMLASMQAAGLQARPDLEAAFYFDLTVTAVTAVNSRKVAKQWPDLQLTKCSQTAAPPPSRSVDLLTALKVGKYRATFRCKNEL